MVKMVKKKTDPFYQHRQTLKGVFVATESPKSTKVIAKALDYRTLREKLNELKRTRKPVAIRYLEPTEAICAYCLDMHLLASERKLVFEEVS